MNRIATIGLAFALVATGAPSLAHQANYEGECDDRFSTGYCETTDPERPAHNRCTGERKWMERDDDDSLHKTAIGLGGATDIVAYVHSPPHSGPSEQDPSVGPITKPGVLWIERNGFSDLQKDDFACSSSAHDESGLQVHSDMSLI